jgi:para-aminobenzoate synthetase component 1
LPPFQGGLAGAFGYGLNRALEPRVPPDRFDEFPSPKLALGVYDWVVSFDHEARRAWLVSTGFADGDMGEEWERQVQAEYRLGEVLRLLRAPGPPRPPRLPESAPLPASALCPQHPLPGFPGVTSNFDRAGYEAAVRRAVQYVHAGDCFQVNLSQRLLAPLREHPLDLYARLRTLNPAPFAGYFDAGDFQILSASPERFLRVYPDGEVETRPIKGTRPRGATPDEDAALAVELAASVKDRAENVMIVDLLRNDIGKVCEYGSVRVPRVCEVETFRFVHHLVSEVRGKLRTRLGPLDLLEAAFPGGSVTGAPKVRAMEIIAELEPTARGPYCGSLGWIGFDGAMDTNILIRTFTAGRGWVQFPVGGGIVADSDPAREYEETLHKAAGLLKALR